MLWLYAIKTSQMSFALVPKVFYAIDMMTLFCK